MSWVCHLNIDLLLYNEVVDIYLNVSILTIMSCVCCTLVGVNIFNMMMMMMMIGCINNFYSLLVTPTFHGTKTLLCHTPPYSIPATVEVSVCNEHESWSLSTGTYSFIPPAPHSSSHSPYSSSYSPQSSHSPTSSSYSPQSSHSPSNTMSPSASTTSPSSNISLPSKGQKVCE